MRRRRDLWAIIALLGLVALAFREVIGPADGLWFGDHGLIFRQRWWSVTETIAHGHLPALTRANGAGVPVESLLNATYTPLIVLFALGPFDVMYDLFVAAHVFLACAGVYLLFRELGFGVQGAWWAALVPLTGPIVSFENLLVGLQGLAYAPWAYWAVARLLRDPGPLNIALVGLGGGWHLQGIMPEIVLMDALVGLALASVRLERRRWPATLAALGAGLLLAWSVAAVELMPAVERLAETRRGQGFSYAEQTVWSLHPSRLTGLVAPSFWSLPEIALARFDGLFGGQSRPYLLSVYGGLLLSAAVTRRRGAIVALGLAVFFVLVSLGPATPLHALIARLPLMTSARYPVKFLVLSMAAVAVALALAPRGLRRHKGIHLPFALHAVGAVGLWLWLGAGVEPLATRLSPPQRELLGVGPSFLPALTTLAMGQRLAHALALPALATLALLVIRAPRPRLRVLSLLLGLDVAWAAGYAVRGAPVGVEPPAAMAALLDGHQQRVYRLGPNDRDAPLIVDPDRPLFPQVVVDNARRGLLAYRTQRPFHDYDPDGQSNQSSATTLALIHRSRYPEAEVLLGRVGVAWVNTWAPVRRPGLRTFAVPGQQPQRVFPIEPHRPYAAAFDRWRRVAPGDVLDPVHRRHLESTDTWNDLLVLDLDAPAATATVAGCAAGAEITAAPAVVTGDVDLAVDLPCPAMVLVQETFVAGWRARVDGTAFPVFQAEMGQTAVPVPAGRHRVELRYPGRIARWWPVSAGGALVVFGLLGVGLARRRAGAGVRPASGGSAGA